MDLSEQRIAELILRVIIKEIRQDELLELQQGYLDVSPANRQKFAELTNFHTLKRKLCEFYERSENAIVADEYLYGTL